MAYTTGSDATGNAAANAHIAAPVQRDDVQPATVGDHAFQEGDGARPPTPVQVNTRNVTRDGAHALANDNPDALSIEDNDRSSIITDDDSSVGTVLIGYPGVDGARGLTTRIYTSRTHSRDRLNDEERFVDEVLKDAAPHVRMNILHDPGLVNGIKRLVFEMGFRGLKIDASKRPGDLDTDKKMIVRQEHLDGTEQAGPSLSDMLLSGILHLGYPEKVSSVMARQLFDRSMGESRQSSTKTDFRAYRERDFTDLENPLSFGDWQRERTGAPAKFEEVIIPGREPGDSGYVQARARAIDATEREQSRARAERNAKPGWVPTSQKD
ncbi:hypothetical protein [Cognatiyoonia sp. IB215182]|uniref:hypothetical protein n=1 Tax=Cognatiyoonia sp. IB215182 TaxID=3097353 RepID=UPI002A0B2BB1|nr:hypothetical protein [Cognatiyoonia sp. IB215182]MDX8353584.1 hypothetical protein [Cognatiyoonia sp. IB215182]